jgi:hypothetical protein
MYAFRVTMQIIIFYVTLKLNGLVYTNRSTIGMAPHIIIIFKSVFSRFWRHYNAKIIKIVVLCNIA